MSVERRTGGILGFGVFELELHTGELRKSGIKVKLQGQPFQILKILLQHPGELVTREELRMQLWPADTFVDFDRSLSKCINKLRQALGDSAESPRFIETLQRRGYRFIADVKEVRPSGEEDAPPADGTEVIPIPKKEIGIRRGRRYVTVAVASAFILTGVAASIMWRGRQSRLTSRDTIVLADFSNNTGNPIFEDTLKQALRASLEQSPFLNILSDERVGEELEMMRQPKDGRVTVELARDVCRRTGSKALLAGSISRLGTHFTIALNALEYLSGSSLGSQQVEADRQEDVLRELTGAATTMRKKLGESLATIQKYDVPVEEVTTSSLEALEAYSSEIKVWATKGNNPSIPFFERAVILDPNFPMGYARLSATLNAAGEATLSIENAKKAYELRGKVSEPERLYIEAHYYRDVTGEADKAAALWQVRQQIYPREDDSYANLAGYYERRGNYEKAVEEARAALQLDQRDEDNFLTLAYLYIGMDRLDDAKAVLDQAAQAKVESDGLTWNRYVLAFLRGQSGEMDREMGASTDKEVVNQSRFFRAAGDLYFGKLKDARKLLQPRAADCVQECVMLGLDEAFFGLGEDARRHASLAIKSNPEKVGHFPWLPLALASATAGDVTRAEEIANRIDNEQPLRTEVQEDWLPTIRAAVALTQKNGNKAVELLQALGSHELGALSLWPIYERGQAYLVLRDGRAAASEFQKIVDHPGIARMEVVEPLAHLGLARAYVLQGDQLKADAAYRDFFVLWKDADEDIPIFREAKKGYANLGISGGR
jgi:DNA-binding winged helix-turn-helix (wHTH) protein/tetratricopeptide (TPR) repeat protein